MATMIERLEIVPLGKALGAEIRGVDLSRPLDPATVAAIRAAWRDHLVLLFRDQKLDEDGQIRFARYLGEPGARASPTQGRGAEEANELIMLVSNIRKDGKPIGSLPDGEMMFHSDMCYVETPHKGTMLYAIEVPSSGGETKLSNQYAAYEALSPSAKARLAGRKAVQAYNYGQQRANFRESEPLRQYAHPAVIIHPETGRKSLYVSRLMTARIEGLDDAESDALLEECFTVSERESNIYAHAWRPGDLLIWDNRCCNHARNDFQATERRLLRRCTLHGDRPIAA